MRTLLPTLLLAICTVAQAQNKNDIGYIAPEGKIINYRTLTWNDFQNKEDKQFARTLAAQGYRAQAYVIPAIYFKWMPGERLENGRVKFKPIAKCAFQSHAFVRDEVKNAHSTYILTHEHDHYDIALVYSKIMEEAVVSKDFSEKNYNEEINNILRDYYNKHQALQEKYDSEVNPEGRDSIDAQELWDMRIKRALDLVTIDLYNAPLSTVQVVKAHGVSVKKLPDDDLRRFCTRVRPLYTEFHDENAAVSKEVKEWLSEPCYLAFYNQRYFIEETGKPVKDCSRTLGYLFIPTGNGMYKRSFIDTFSINDAAPKVSASFFANADSDGVRELVIQTTMDRKDREATGRHYSVRVYDNVSSRPFPGRLKKLEIPAELAEGFEGTLNGKPQKAKYKTEKEVADALVKAGFNEVAAPQAEVKKVIRR
ncbi:MAG: hypothetical protein KF744_11210 [Taibaiella sp.]|nr:hypothetical protein [Taibaiella sp.]